MHAADTLFYGAYHTRLTSRTTASHGSFQAHNARTAALLCPYPPPY